ncbi:hypothetical protein EU805_01065 [Salipiger sp. IMCC34102]|uniref:hypothetical protein n=1 Tax=Salipiger sp. IMCC34102 TaxID=2510647 RepID=UPI00101C1E80|nr:hypothetical protein [Salipiger sp. IMCC34102]RYH03992.1 hypothetical protein EU805_01065 [Salipiger sp. IMCC34102]
MTQVIVHPGFHKTGTSSLQNYLHQNRAALAPYLAYYGKSDFLRAGTAARRYALKPYPWRLRAFRRAFDAFLAGIPDAPLIVLSRETFSGEMPGNRRSSGRLIRSYERTAQRLACQITAALRARFGEEVAITFLYTLRARDPWIRSVYGHLLRSTRLTDDFDTFRARFPDLPDLAEQARRIALTVDLRDLHLCPLEDYADRREGPAAAILDLVQLPATLRADLPHADRANVHLGAELEAAFLAANRAGGTSAEVRTRKDALLEAARAHRPDAV